jgi:pyrroline-5-carboxylate reductase
MTYRLIGKGNLGKHLQVLFNKNGWQEEIVSGVQNVYCLAVKPKDVVRVLQEETKDASELDVVVSCAAGVQLDTLEDCVPHLQVVRCMPNICVSQGKGAVVWYGNISENTKNDLEQMMEGPVNVWVDDEDQLDKATALFASQPAFQAYIAEAYIDFAVHAGFTKEDARRLYADTLVGTGELLHSKTTKAIIGEVSSEGGITERGIRRLKKEKVQKSLKLSTQECFMHLHNIVKKLN